MLWGSGLDGGFLAVEVSTGSERLSRAGINALNPLCVGGHKLQREQKEDRSGEEGGATLDTVQSRTECAAQTTAGRTFQ